MGNRLDPSCLNNLQIIWIYTTKCKKFDHSVEKFFQETIHLVPNYMPLYTYL